MARAPALLISLNPSWHHQTFTCKQPALIQFDYYKMPYVCELCLAIFQDYVQLTLHYKTSHNIELAQAGYSEEIGTRGGVYFTLICCCRPAAVSGVVMDTYATTYY